MTIKKIKKPDYRKSIKELNKERCPIKIEQLKGSPCLECLVSTTCTKSSIDNTMCEKMKKFIYSLIKKENEKEEKRRMKKQKGFTLIELLIVILIVGIVVLIAFAPIQEFITSYFNSMK